MKTSAELGSTNTFKPVGSRVILVKKDSIVSAMLSLIIGIGTSTADPTP